MPHRDMLTSRYTGVACGRVCTVEYAVLFSIILWLDTTLTVSM